MFKNPNPNCDKECLFTKGDYITTLVEYTPMYDKHGNNINPDRNTTYYNISCMTCRKIWCAEECMGETTIRERM